MRCVCVYNMIWWWYFPREQSEWIACCLAITDRGRFNEVFMQPLTLFCRNNDFRVAGRRGYCCPVTLLLRLLCSIPMFVTVLVSASKWFWCRSTFKTLLRLNGGQLFGCSILKRLMRHPSD